MKTMIRELPAYYVKLPWAGRQIHLEMRYGEAPGRHIALAADSHSYFEAARQQ